MKRIIKDGNSLVLQRRLSYNNRGDRIQIRNILLNEQHRRCAYTEAYFTPTHTPSIDHFNPLLKETAQDEYKNWFVINQTWNNLKGGSRRWNEFNLTIHPTDENFEDRIFYENGLYKAHPEDDEAQRFIDYLCLNQIELVKDRVELIERLKDLKRDLNIGDNQEFKSYLETKFPHEIQYLRAIEKELKITF